MSDILIIGNGVAGDSAATAISRSDKQPEVKIFTGEKYPFYQRTRLGEVLGGKTPPEDIILHDAQWYADRGLELRMETTVREIDPEKRVVRTESADRYTYEKLLLAPGASPLLPPIKGLDKGNVFSLRTLADVQTIKTRLPEVEKAVVIGGGLLGLETAYSLNQRQIKVTVVEALPLIMGKQLDETGSKYVQSRLEEEGIDFALDTRVDEIRGKNPNTFAVLDTGRNISNDLIIISAGVSPRTRLATDAGLEAEKGIIVDRHLRTSQPEIFAAGDAIEQNGRCYGIWPPAQEQGRIAGKNLVGEQEEYDGSLSYYKLKVAGIDMISAGMRDEEEANKVLVNREESRRVYKKFFLNDDEELIGAILVGDKSCYPTVLNGLRTDAGFDELNEELELLN